MQKREKQYLIMDSFYRSMKEALSRLTLDGDLCGRDFVALFVLLAKKEFSNPFPSSSVTMEQRGVDVCVFDSTGEALLGVDFHIRSTKGKKGPWDDPEKARETFLSFLCGVSCLIDKSAGKSVLRYFEYGHLVFEETMDFRMMMEYGTSQ